MRRATGRSPLAAPYAVQTELGGMISGAQASLYQRAQSALEDILPLLRNLKPLKTDADEEDMEAARSIFQTGITALVEEMGKDTGPIVLRVDTLFNLLSGTGLGEIEETFGLNSDSYNTVDEERRNTDFFVIRDTITGLEAARNSSATA